MELMSLMKFLVALLLATMVLAAPACRTAYDIDLAPIHEVDVRFAESYPEQVFVYIKGGLRDGCTSFYDQQMARNGDAIAITVRTKHPRGAVCPAIYTYFERNINLGADFARGRTYTLKVNDFTTTFAYPQ